MVAVVVVVVRRHTAPYVPMRGAKVACVHCKPVGAADSALFL